MAAENLGSLRVSLGLDSAQFTESITDINRRLKAVRSEFAATGDGTRAYAKSLDGLKSKSENLNRQLVLQRNKVLELKRQHDDSAAATGADAAATQDLMIAYNRAQGVLNRTEAQLRQTTQQITHQESAWHSITTSVTTSVGKNKRDIAALESSYRSMTSGIADFGSETSHVQSEITHLTSVLGKQEDSVKDLERAYDEAKRSKGEDAAETQDALIAYNNARTSMNRTAGRVDHLTDRLQAQTSTFGRVGKKLTDLGDKYQKTGDKIRNASSSAAQGFGAGTLAIGGGVGLAAKEAMDFEAQMSAVKAVMSPDEVTKFSGVLNELAITMGSKTKYSATESAKGIEELVKAGVNVTDIINGGLDGALNLATAGELELADAAEIASTALNAFQKDNLTVSRSADILAGAANASATSVGEMKFGMSAVATVASGTGFTFEETAASLATFAQNGLKGSDAGTSLKTMMMNLSPKTKAQREQFDELGLSQYNTAAGYKYLIDKGITPAGRSVGEIQEGMKKLAAQELGSGATKAKLTKEYERIEKASGLASSAFYKEDGTIRSMSEVAGLLQNSMSGLNDEQRQTALNTMFGSDAIRAGNILYKEGSAGIDKMTTSLNKIKASDVAKEKLNNFKGVVEQLKGSLSTAAITIGTALLPAMKKITKVVQAGVTWFNNLSPAMQQTLAIGAGVTVVVLAVATAVAGLVAVIGAGVAGFGAITGALGIGATAMAGAGGAAATAGGLLGGLGGAAGLLGTAFTILTGPVGLAIAAIAAIGIAAYKINDHMKKPVIAIKGFGDEVSKSTKKAVNSYLDMDTKATESLNMLAWSNKTVTKKMADDMVAQYDLMGKKINESLDKNHAAQKQKTQALFDKNSGITAEEEAKILAEMDQTNEGKKKRLEGYEKTIEQITRNAVKNKRALTEGERIQIAEIQGKMREQAVETMSKSAKEQQAIMSSLKSQAGIITAEQAAKVVSNSKKAKDGSVKEAEKTYKGQVKQIEYMRDVTGKVTEEQAKRMLKAAEKTRKGSVDKAEDMHKKVVKAAKNQAKEHAEKIDWETGKVKTGWQTMGDKVSDTWESITNFFGGDDKKKKKKKSKKKYANGTPNGRHTGGPALVGEEGRELAHIPGQGLKMLGSGGQGIVNLPKGSSVLPHRYTEKVMKQYGLPAYKGGVGDFFDQITKGPEAVWNSAASKFGLSDSVIPDWFTEKSGSPVKAIGKLASSKIKDMIGSFGFGGDDSGSAANFGAGAGKARGWITQAMKLTNTPGMYLNGLMKIAQKESGFNPKAINLWDSNFLAGHPSKGLFQTIPTTFAAHNMEGMNDIYNPVHNATAAIRYMNSRYGSISNVPGLRNMAGGGGYVGYESGGIITKQQMAMVGEGNKKEAIIPLEQYRGRAIKLWMDAGKTLGMFNTPQRPQVNKSMNSGSSNSSSIGSTVTTNHDYHIYVEYKGDGNDSDVATLAKKIKEHLAREDRQASRALGVNY